MKLKHILISGATAGTLLFSSCSKVLEVTPQQSVDASNAIQTPEDVDQLIIGAYAIMGGGQLYGTNLFLLPDLLGASPGLGSTSAGRYLTWQGTFQGQRQVYQKTMTRDNSESSRTWIAAYRAINIANLALANLDKVTDPAQRSRLEGEALLTRGVMHFELVRLFALPWGTRADNSQPGVVIQTTAVSTAEAASEVKPRSTVAQVYAAVLADITSATTKLPATNGTRFNRFTAQAFLARVYLQQSNFAGARDAANAVIQSGNYRLNASVAAVFSNKNTAESIFEVQQNDQNNAGQSNDGMATFYASITGVGRGDARVPAGFPTLYPAGDLRASELFYQGRSNRPGTYSGKWRSFTQNLPVIRIAEMFLIRAETNIRLGTVIGDTPANDLARIRNSVRTNSIAPAAPTLQDVLNERLLELAYEGHRVHDIRRLQQTNAITITLSGAPTPLPWNADRLVMPIPVREIDASRGTIIQNPGY